MSLLDGNASIPKDDKMTFSSKILQRTRIVIRYNKIIEQRCNTSRQQVYWLKIASIKPFEDVR